MGLRSRETKGKEEEREKKEDRSMKEEKGIGRRQEELGEEETDSKSREIG